MDTSFWISQIAGAPAEEIECMRRMHKDYKGDTKTVLGFVGTIVGFAATSIHARNILDLLLMAPVVGPSLFAVPGFLGALFSEN